MWRNISTLSMSSSKMTRGSGRDFGRFVILMMSIHDPYSLRGGYGQNVTLTIISFASMIAGIACNIQNREPRDQIKQRSDKVQLSLFGCSFQPTDSRSFACHTR
jgi:hypothetical protein